MKKSVDKEVIMPNGKVYRASRCGDQPPPEGSYWQVTDGETTYKFPLSDPTCHNKANMAVNMLLHGTIYD